MTNSRFLLLITLQTEVNHGSLQSLQAVSVQYLKIAVSPDLSLIIIILRYSIRRCFSKPPDNYCRSTVCTGKGARYEDVPRSKRTAPLVLNLGMGWR